VLLNRRAVLVEETDQRITQILEQVPAVRHLHRVGRPGMRAFGIAAAPIPTDQFDTGMFL
jgi:hypothetical protein